MSADYPVRQSHPVQDPHQAIENHRMICGVRGYCGPFINEAFYNAFPDAMWHGYGECTVCCSTCLIEQEELKRQRIESAAAGAQPCASPPKS